MSIIQGLTQHMGCGNKAPAAGEKFLHFLEKNVVFLNHLIGAVEERLKCQEGLRLR